MTLLQQIINRTAQSFGQSLQSMVLCIIDIVLTLLVKLDRPQGKAGGIGKL